MIFPADAGADFAGFCLHNRKCGPVSHAPNESLRCGWKKLSVFSGKSAFGVEEERGAVKSMGVLSMHPTTKEAPVRAERAASSSHSGPGTSMAFS